MPGNGNGKERGKRYNYRRHDELVMLGRSSEKKNTGKDIER